MSVTDTMGENSGTRTEHLRTQKTPSQYSNAELPPLEVIERGLWTKRVCMVGIAATWATGIGCIIYGGIVQSITNRSDNGDEPAYLHHKAIGPFVQLAASFWVTALSDVTGLVHSTSLRFTLFANRQLTFNSNLRLFTSCPNSRVHWWPVNCIWGWCLVSSYACATMLLVESVYDYFDDESATPDKSFNLDIVSGYALIFLGLGLLGQAAIATWALVVTDIPTWSTNPIHTARICQSQGWLAPLSQRTMLSVHDSAQVNRPPVPALPKIRQDSLLKAHSLVRRALIFVWSVTLAGFVWFAAVSIAYQVGGTNLGPSWGSFSRSYTNDWSLIPNWVGYTAFLAISTSLGQSFYTFGPWFVCKYLLTSAFIGGITMNLHVVELLVQCSRDESLWRQTASAEGLRPGAYGAFRIAFTSWHTVTLFVFKAVLHWIFSLAFGVYWEGVEIRIPQVCYNAIVLFLLAGLATFLALWRPRGPQPATFGHLPTLIDLIDVWPCHTADERAREDSSRGHETGISESKDTVTLYWGDKGEDANGIRHAGTSHSPLGPIVVSSLYL